MYVLSTFGDGDLDRPGERPNRVLLLVLIVGL